MSSEFVAANGNRSPAFEPAEKILHAVSHAIVAPVAARVLSPARAASNARLMTKTLESSAQRIPVESFDCNKDEPLCWLRAFPVREYPHGLALEEFEGHNAAFGAGKGHSIWCSCLRGASPWPVWHHGRLG
jgi:hypothetical protein